MKHKRVLIKNTTTWAKFKLYTFFKTVISIQEKYNSDKGYGISQIGIIGYKKIKESLHETTDALIPW